MPTTRRKPRGKLADPEWRRRRARLAAEARTTPQHHFERIRGWVEESRAAQGLPRAVTDELTLGQVAELLARATPKRAGKAAA